jgi:ABC-type antimicrobial peptide transport system permease subunit
MPFERPIGSGPEPTSAPPAAAAAIDDAVTPAMRLQILSNEHWGLLATQTLAWNETFTRAGMFLSTLSGAIIAIALVAQATAFGEGFRLFALAILPVVLIVGVGTQLRLGQSNYHAFRCAIGMNRIRAAYMELAPDLERYLVMGTTDDDRGLMLTAAIPPGTSFAVQLLSGTPILVVALDALIVAAIVAIMVFQVGGATALALTLGAIGFVLTVAAFVWYAGRAIRRIRRDRDVMYPSRQPADQASPEDWGPGGRRDDPRPGTRS